MNRDQLGQFLTEIGWKKDSFGHFHDPKGKYRIKMQARSVRYEVKVLHEATKYVPKSTSWMRLYSGFYKDLYISNGKIIGLKR